MLTDDKDIVCKFSPEISAFRNAVGSVSILVTGMNQQDSIAIPLESVKPLAKALNAIAKEWK